MSDFIMVVLPIALLWLAVEMWNISNLSLEEAKEDTYPQIIEAYEFVCKYKFIEWINFTRSVMVLSVLIAIYSGNVYWSF